MGYPFGNNLTRPEPVRIAVTMPITSRGDVAAGVAGMRVFNSFLPSFLATAFPTAFPCAFDFWLAYDMGDALLDSPQVRVPPPPPPPPPPGARPLPIFFFFSNK